MLVALIALLLLGGGESPFIDPNLIKHIKANVEDSAREAEVVEIAKDHRKWVKSNNKAFSKINQKLAKLNANREATREDFTTLFDQVQELKSERQSHHISARLTVADLITSDEWSAILNTIDQTEAKTDKSIAKASAQLTKTFDTFRSKVAGRVDDEANRAAALISIGKYEAALQDLTAVLVHFNYRDAPILRERDATIDQLRLAAQEITQRRAKAQGAFVELHFELLENTTAKEWPHVARAMNKL